ncbi:MAG: protein phosphatase CheZ [Salinisphaera sp.]|nr:protein phosphatase CheZ [Salinisphaera sp.]
MSTDKHAGTAEEANADDLIDRIGQLTRALHDSMRELGLDREVEKAAEAIPDARDRLSYIADMTEKAADRALSATEIAQPMQEDLAQRAELLTGQWDGWFAAPRDLGEARTLVAATRDYLRWVPEQTAATQVQLREIMMAQDFQDLTGQVVGRLIDVIKRIESQLIEVLVDNIGADHIAERKRAPRSVEQSLVNGPQIAPHKQADVVSGQAQVDDLLESLGF